MTRRPATAQASTSPRRARGGRRSSSLQRAVLRRPLRTLLSPSMGRVRVGRAATDPADRADRGAATVWLLLVVPAMLVSAGIVVDGGRALDARQQATGLAGEAARAAVDRVDAGAYRDLGAVFVPAPGTVQLAACSWVARARPDAACRATPGAGGLVEVTVTLTYSPVLLPTGPLTATGRGAARPAVGVEQEEPIR